MIARMRILLALLAGTVALTALTGASLDLPALVLAGTAVLAVGIVVLVAVVAAAPRTLQVGDRAERHRNALDRTPEPAHPATAGRPRPRAPGTPASAA